MHFKALFNKNLGIQYWQIIHQSKVYKVEKTNTYDSDPFFKTVEINFDIFYRFAILTQFFPFRQ